MEYKKKKKGMFGRLIRNIRDLQNISQEELARGICSVKTLEKYERGEREPEKLVADALFQRLKKSMEKFEVILSCTEYRQALKRQEIQGMLRMGELAAAEKEIELYVKIDRALHYQYACFLRAELLRKKQAPVKEQMENVVDGIYQTLSPRRENTIRQVTLKEKSGSALIPEMLAAGCYSKMELYLFERYAILLEESGKVKEALRWYEGIVKYLDDKEYDRADQYALYPIMAYQLAAYDKAQGRYDAARGWAMRGCEMLCRKKEQLALYCRLMELKFEIEDSQGAGLEADKEEREAYRKLCSAIPDRTANWKENWYPMYPEKHLLCFNEIVRERRRAKGMSKAELAYEICDVRTLERLEACENTPRYKEREKLLEKLGLSTEKYNGGIVTARYGDYRKYGEMAELCQKRDYQKAKILYEELKKNMDMENITNIQWAEYWDIQITDGIRSISKQEKEYRIWNILQITLPVKKGYSSFECQLLRHERNSLIWIAGEAVSEDKKQREILLRQLRRYYQNRGQALFEWEYLIRLFIQVANLFRLGGEFSMALRYLHMAEKKIILNDFWDVWEYVLCYRQLVLQEMGTEKIDFQCARQAYAISLLYAENRTMRDYLLEQFGEDAL